MTTYPSGSSRVDLVSRRHPDYYFQGDVVFSVEGTLFCVHRYFFDRESDYFSQEFSKPDEDIPRGSSDAHPFVLNGITKQDFTRFLWVFYNPAYKYENGKLDDWLSILKLSDLWGFTRVKDLSIRYIEQNELDPVKRIAIYQEYHANRAISIPYFIELIERPAPLTTEEAHRVGLDTALTIMQAREFARGTNGPQGRLGAPIQTTKEEIADFVRRTFFPLPVKSPLHGGSNHTGGVSLHEMGPQVPQIVGHGSRTSDLYPTPSHPPPPFRENSYGFPPLPPQHVSSPPSERHIARANTEPLNQSPLSQSLYSERRAPSSHSSSHVRPPLNGNHVSSYYTSSDTPPRTLSYDQLRLDSNVNRNSQGHTQQSDDPYWSAVEPNPPAHQIFNPSASTSTHARDSPDYTSARGSDDYTAASRSTVPTAPNGVLMDWFPGVRRVVSSTAVSTRSNPTYEATLADMERDRAHAEALAAYELEHPREEILRPREEVVRPVEAPQQHTWEDDALTAMEAARVLASSAEIERQEYLLAKQQQAKTEQEKRERAAILALRRERLAQQAAHDRAASAERERQHQRAREAEDRLRLRKSIEERELKATERAQREESETDESVSMRWLTASPRLSDAGTAISVRTVTPTGDDDELSTTSVFLEHEVRPKARHFERVHKRGERSLGGSQPKRLENRTEAKRLAEEAEARTLAEAEEAKRKAEAAEAAERRKEEDLRRRQEAESKRAEAELKRKRAEQLKREEQERLARENAERLLREEQERREREETERLAREQELQVLEEERRLTEEEEERFRLEEERLAQERDAQIALEIAERLAREEAERHAEDLAEKQRRAQTEAERAKREESRRIRKLEERTRREEEERLTREREEQARREEEERARRQEEERLIREREEQVRREEEERLAREEAERLDRLARKEEEERLAREEEERRAREEEERLVRELLEQQFKREEEERLARQQEEKDKLAREEEERLVRELLEEQFKREEEERLVREKEEKERLAREEKERFARELVEKQRKQEEEEQAAREREEAERRRKEEEERRAQEEQRLAREREEQLKREEEKRLAREREEEERFQRERQERLEREREERLARERDERLSRERGERLVREREERMAQEKEKAEAAAKHAEATVQEEKDKATIQTNLPTASPEPEPNATVEPVHLSAEQKTQVAAARAEVERTEAAAVAAAEAARSLREAADTAAAEAEKMSNTGDKIKDVRFRILQRRATEASKKAAPAVEKADEAKKAHQAAVAELEKLISDFAAGNGSGFPGSVSSEAVLKASVATSDTDSTHSAFEDAENANEDREERSKLPILQSPRPAESGMGGLIDLLDNISLSSGDPNTDAAKGTANASQGPLGAPHLFSPSATPVDPIEDPLISDSPGKDSKKAAKKKQKKDEDAKAKDLAAIVGEGTPLSPTVPLPASPLMTKVQQIMDPLSRSGTPFSTMSDNDAEDQATGEAERDGGDSLTTPNKKRSIKRKKVSIATS